MVVHVYIYRLNVSMLEGGGEEAVSWPLNRLEADRGWKAK